MRRKSFHPTISRDISPISNVERNENWKVSLKLKIMQGFQMRLHNGFNPIVKFSREVNKANNLHEEHLSLVVQI